VAYHHHHHHHHHHHYHHTVHTGIYYAPITIEQQHRRSTIQHKYAMIKMAKPTEH